jgi:hypothetical protein
LKRRALTTAFLDPASAYWPEVLADLAHDVYHLPAYAAFAAHWQEPGDPVAFVAEDGANRLLVPLIVRRVPDSLSPAAPRFDATSPRGYPGVIVGPGAHGSPAVDAFTARAVAAFKHAARDRAIVAAFVRLHPLLSPTGDALRSAGTVVEHGESVSIDLGLSRSELWRQTRSNHRRDIERATRLGYRARIDEGWTRCADFVRVYLESMDRLGAQPFWRLSAPYIEALRAALGDRIHLCVVERDGAVAAAGLLTEVDGIVEYHLAGTADDHVKASPSKVVIDFARSWAKARGNRVLHLAGSLRHGDTLSHFKAGFSPLRHPVCSWRVVTDPAGYAALRSRWEAINGGVADPGDDFFPAYRRPVERPG